MDKDPKSRLEAVKEKIRLLEKEIAALQLRHLQHERSPRLRRSRRRGGRLRDSGSRLFARGVDPCGNVR